MVKVDLVYRRLTDFFKKLIDWFWNRQSDG